MSRITIALRQSVAARMLVHEAVHPQGGWIDQRSPGPLARSGLGLQAIAVVDFGPVIIEMPAGGRVLAVQVHRGQRTNTQLLDGTARIELATDLYLRRRARADLELIRAR